MKCGYKYTDHNTLVQIVCNDNKGWYRRESRNGQGFGTWKKIEPPTIINNRLKVASGFIGMSPLYEEPAGVPTM